MSAKHGKPKKTDRIEQDLEAGQDRLADDINELVTRFHPKNVFARGKHKVTTAAKSFFVADNGEAHLPRIAGAGAAVIGAVAVIARGARK